jgi:hypothetical protein
MDRQIVMGGMNARMYIHPEKVGRRIALGDNTHATLPSFFSLELPNVNIFFYLQKAYRKVGENGML